MLHVLDTLLTFRACGCVGLASALLQRTSLGDSALPLDHGRCTDHLDHRDQRNAGNKDSPRAGGPALDVTFVRIHHLRIRPSIRLTSGNHFSLQISRPHGKLRF
eukprot:5772078-Amphidinium_carterae.1